MKSFKKVFLFTIFTSNALASTVATKEVEAEDKILSKTLDRTGDLIKNLENIYFSRKFQSKLHKFVSLCQESMDERSPMKQRKMKEKTKNKYKQKDGISVDGTNQLNPKDVMAFPDELSANVEDENNIMKIVILSVMKKMRNLIVSLPKPAFGPVPKEDSKRRLKDIEQSYQDMNVIKKLRIRGKKSGFVESNDKMELVEQTINPWLDLLERKLEKAKTLISDPDTMQSSFLQVQDSISTIIVQVIEKSNIDKRTIRNLEKSNKKRDEAKVKKGKKKEDGIEMDLDVILERVIAFLIEMINFVDEFVTGALP